MCGYASSANWPSKIFSVPQGVSKYYSLSKLPFMATLSVITVYPEDGCGV